MKLQAPTSKLQRKAKESPFFLRMIAASEPKLVNEARQGDREAMERHLIFASRYRNPKV